MKRRIRLDEEDFKTLVKEGEVTIDGVIIEKEEMDYTGDFDKLINGKMIEQSNAQIILADIGFDRIYKIIGH